MWVLKLDSFGCDTSGCHTVGMDTERSRSVRDIIVYPNPASEKITIDVGDASAHQDCLIEIYNITGVKVKCLKNTVNNTLKIDVKDLVHGLYLGKIISNNGEVGSVKFVVE